MIFLSVRVGYEDALDPPGISVPWGSSPLGLLIPPANRRPVHPTRRQASLEDDGEQPRGEDEDDGGSRLQSLVAETQLGEARRTIEPTGPRGGTRKQGETWPRQAGHHGAPGQQGRAYQKAGRQEEAERPGAESAELAHSLYTGEREGCSLLVHNRT